MVSLTSPHPLGTILQLFYHFPKSNFYPFALESCQGAHMGEDTPAPRCCPQIRGSVKNRKMQQALPKPVQVIKSISEVLRGVQRACMIRWKIK